MQDNYLILCSLNLQMLGMPNGKEIVNWDNYVVAKMGKLAE